MFNHIDPQTVFVIIPAYNEFQTLRGVVDHLEKKHYRFAVVDDGSSENLYQLIIGKKAFFLRHQINLGQGAALQTGIDFALSHPFRFLVTFDADGQHDVDDIEKMIKALCLDKADIAFGSRFAVDKNSIPFKRKCLLQAARYVNYLFTGLLLTDAHNGLRVMTRATAEKIHLRENRMAHATEILSVIERKKLKYVEVPVQIHYTEYSQTKGQNAMSSFRILFDLLLNKIFR